MSDDTQAVEDSQEEDNALGLSDEEFANLDPADMDMMAEADSSGAAEDESADEQDIEAEETSEEEGDEPDEDEAADEDSPDDQESDDNDDSDSTDNADSGDGSSDSDDDDDSREKDEAINYEAFYKHITEEFTANGRKMKVSSAEDIIKLMQMGAGFNRKMAELKPNLKKLRMLDKHGLLNDEKLNYLIDLEKKDPKAIAKLVADSKIDPLDLDVKDVEYVGSDYSVDEREVDLQQVVAEIQHTDTYDRMTQVVLKEWDAKSKQAIADDPQLLKALNDQMAAGVYDRISTEIEQERMFGRLDGKSDIEAYQLMGQKLATEGAFDHLDRSQAQGQQKSPAQSDSADSKKKEQAEIRRKKRKAASPAKSTAAKKTGNTSDFNPLGMTDEDFQKQFDAKFL